MQKKMSYTVRLSSMLPIPETADACDLETRKIVKLLTGRMIHVIEYNGTLLMSKEAYEELQKAINTPT